MSAERRGRRIVVGYDGSETAGAALDYAVDRAGPGGEVIVVYAFGPPPDWLGVPNYQRILNDHQERGRAALDAIALEGHDALLEIEYDTELVGGQPAEAIAAVARAREADEIVVGSRGFGRARAALGSVSHDLLHRADRPIVVVPPPSHADER